MRGVIYKSERTVAVEEVDEPAIEDRGDAIVRITTTNICGSDLHMYEGRTSAETGTLLGHENMGIVEEVGPGVTRIRIGDRVSVPFNYGTFFTEGQRMGTGQAPVKRYNRQVRDLIVAGRARPGWIVSHELSLDQAPDAYERFDRRDDGWTKVLLHPAA